MNSRGFAIFALFMVQQNRSKLPKPVRSMIFDESSYVDTFFSDEEVIAAVRGASPVIQNDGLQFIHKTVQEHLPSRPADEKKLEKNRLEGMYSQSNAFLSNKRIIALTIITCTKMSVVFIDNVL